MSDARPALEYLLASSDTSLESFELSRRNQAANLRKQVQQLLGQLIEAEVDAGLSRSLLECRRARAMTPSLRSDYAPKLGSPEQLAIAFPPERVEISAATTQRGHLAQSEEFGDVRVCPLLEDAIALYEDLENVAEGYATKVRKPYTKPVARKCLAGSPGVVGPGVMRTRLRPKAQGELEFERGSYAASGLETEDKRDAPVPCAVAEGLSFPSERALAQASGEFAETGVVRMTQRVLQERFVGPAKRIRVPRQFVHLCARSVVAVSARAMPCSHSLPIESEPSAQIVFAAAPSCPLG
jgi:hypothetical protein